MLLDNLLKEPLVIKDGCLELATAPGFGIEIDERKLEKLKNAIGPRVVPFRLTVTDAAANLSTG